MTTHLNPDWDGVASLKSMELFLKKSNCPYTIVCEGQLPNNAEDILPNVVYPSTLKEKLDGAVLLILDTDDFLRIPAILNDLSFSKIFLLITTISIIMDLITALSLSIQKLPQLRK